ncbi:MAG: N-acetyl-alpha-D-glucosaminyl L-malate synthase BshA [Flavobacteriales bacterium]
MKHKLKIGIVCFPTYGGSGIVATELGRALAKKGHEIHFITYQQPVRLELFEENVHYHEVSTVDYPLFEFPPYELSLAAKMVDVISYEKLDVLHVHYAIPNAYVAYSAKQILLQAGIAIPIITTLHGTDITLVGKSALLKPVISFAINQSDYVTSVSEDLKKETCSYFDIKAEKIHVVPNFIDLKEYQLPKTEEYQKRRARLKRIISPNGESVLVHISNFRPVKRVQDVVEIFRRVNEKQASTLLMVGDGPCKDDIEKSCRKLGLSKRVRFIGKSSDIPQVLDLCDLMLLPSETESFGLVALEAMASGVPVISSNTGGLPEVNVDGKTGFVAEVGDVETMSQQALSILSDKKKLNQFKTNARAHAQRFDLPNILPAYEQIYCDILKCENYLKSVNKIN